MEEVIVTSGDDLLSIFRRNYRHLRIRITRNTCLELNEMTILKSNNAILEIIGEGEGDDRPILICNAHSIFKVLGRRPTLSIKNIKLVHSCANAPPDVGACIFGLYLSKIVLEDCRLESCCGFGLWFVQQASADIKNCCITSTSRSGIASFGQAQVNIINTLIHDCKIHAVCARGDTKINLKRALYPTVDDIENNIFNGDKWKQYLIIVDSVFCTRTRAEQETLFNNIQTFHIEMKLKELYELVNRTIYKDGEFYWHTKGEYVKSLQKFLGDKYPKDPKWSDSLLYRPETDEMDNVEWV